MILYRHFHEAQKDSHLHHLAMGFFDGLHLGHQAVITQNLPLAKSKEVKEREKTCVLTFQSHPQAILFPEKAPLLITGLSHKLHLLDNWQIRATLALPFNKKIASESAESFLFQLETHFPNLRSISVGPNWRFGHKRLGTIPMLSDWCAKHDIILNLAQSKIFEDELISSSRIRHSIQMGNLKEASQMLGRNYSLYGTVIKGQQLGRTIGIPTVNLKTEDQCFPPNGVYQGITELSDGRSFLSAINIGTKPSVTPKNPIPTIESHLIDFDEDLYGKTVNIIPQLKIRDEIKFNSTQELQSQIEQDIEKIRQNSLS